MDYFVFKEEGEALRADTLVDLFYGVKFAKEEGIFKVAISNDIKDMSIEIDIKNNNKILDAYLEIEKLYYKFEKEIIFENSNSIKKTARILDNFGKRITYINLDELFLAFELSKTSMFYEPQLFLHIGSLILGPSFKEFEESELIFNEYEEEDEEFVA